MPEPEKLEFDQLEAGHEFPPVKYTLDKSMVDLFLKAVEETSDVYENGELVPPMALAAQAMAALTACVSVPPGSIHVSQELEFVSAVNTGNSITCSAKVLRKQERGGMRLMMVGLEVFDTTGEKVLVSRTGFVLPEKEE